MFLARANASMVLAGAAFDAPRCAITWVVVRMFVEAFV